MDNEKQIVFVLLDDSYHIVNIYNNEEKAVEEYDRLSSISPRESFFYFIEKWEVL